MISCSTGRDCAGTEALETSCNSCESSLPLLALGAPFARAGDDAIVVCQRRIGGEAEKDTEEVGLLRAIRDWRERVQSMMEYLRAIEIKETECEICLRSTILCADDISQKVVVDREAGEGAASPISVPLGAPAWISTQPRDSLVMQFLLFAIALKMQMQYP